MTDIISKGFLLFRDFCRQQLDEDPIALIGQNAWATMVEVSEVFERERQHCISLLNAFEWTCTGLAEAAAEAPCTECGSTLIEPKGDVRRPDIRCLSCGTTTDFEKFAVHALGYHFDGHINYMDGGEPEVITCPHCSSEALHLESGTCAVCEESVETVCSMCSNPIPASEISDTSICGYCWQVRCKDD